MALKLHLDDLIDFALADGGVVDWKPIPDSPQELAYHSQADVLGYGGAAGGGKSSLQMGLAMTQHREAIIYRRHYADLDDLIKKGDSIQNGRCRFILGYHRAWQTPDKRTIKLGAVEHEKDLNKFQGRERDYIGIDEATQFPENYFRWLIGWLRTPHKKQRTRVVLTFNPPQNVEGEWVISYFGAWLNDEHPNPAKPGELRWYIRLNDEDVEVADNSPVIIDGQAYKPESRTFIPARVEDNPYLMNTGYRDQLNKLPEPLRSQMLFGSFSKSAKPNEWQVIPTAWVLEAQKRSKTTSPSRLAMRAIGVDVARGGDDRTTICTVRGTRFELESFAGTETPNGKSVAELTYRRAENVETPVGVDVIGVGASAYDATVDMMSNVIPFNASSASFKTDQSGKYGFINLRAEAWWKLREALDPESGENIALPDLRELRIELCAPRFTTVGARYKIEDKEAIKKRIGRSPDLADAVVIAWYVAQNNRERWGGL